LHRVREQFPTGFKSVPYISTSFVPSELRGAERSDATSEAFFDGFSKKKQTLGRGEVTVNFSMSEIDVE
jgi:hypothetical protein